MAKPLWELIEECETRGRIDKILIYKLLTSELINTVDKDDALSEYGYAIIGKHKRNRTELKVWIL